MGIRTQAGIVAVWLGLAACPVLAQAPSDASPDKPAAPSHYSPQRGAWWTNIFGTAPPPKLETEGKPDPRLGGQDQGTPNRSPGSRATQARRLEEEFMRRLEVCDRLKEIAMKNDDKKLLTEAEQLETLAWTTHEQQCRRLGLMVAPSATDGRSAASTLQSASPGGDTRRPARRADASASLREGE
jgi:hypothetical protein